MDLRWVNILFESSCCWPEYCMVLGSAQQGMCKLDRHSAQPVFCVSCNICPAVTLGLLPFIPRLSVHFHVSLCLFLQIPHFLMIPPAISPPYWLAIPRLRGISSRKIQYLSQSVWVHSPLSLGVLPVALRWISPGLIDITLAMKYAYHDQRWWQVRRHLYRSSKAGVDVLLETKCLWITLSKAAALKINCSYIRLFERDLWM